jgi:hypothetical protein
LVLDCKNGLLISGVAIIELELVSLDVCFSMIVELVNVRSLACETLELSLLNVRRFFYEFKDCLLCGPKEWCILFVACFLNEFGGCLALVYVYNRIVACLINELLILFQLKDC